MGWVGWLIGGLIVGLIIGIIFDFGSFLFGLFGSLAGAMLGLIFGIDVWLIVWLAGWLGFSLGAAITNSLFRGLASSRFIGLPTGIQQKYNQVYKYRRLWIWWYRQPTTSELETALRWALNTNQPSNLEVWHRLLQHWPDSKSASIDRHISNLTNQDWVERFRTHVALTRIGGKSMPVLQRALTDNESSLTETIVWVMRRIANEADSKLAKQADELLCPECFVRYHHHEIYISLLTSITYYGCRNCGQNHRWITQPGKVVAILDVDCNNVHRKQEDVLWINWLKHRSLFDFDSVRIIKAGDEEVERFAVQIGNDTDEWRKSRYSHLSCVVASDCAL
jgi:RNase P subunit RPR2